MAEAAPVKSVENVDNFDNNEEPQNEVDNDAEGYEFEMVHPLPTEYKCVFCHGIVRNATNPPCGHVYCKTCLSKWEYQQFERQQKLEGFDEQKELVYECAQCRQKYRETDVIENIVVDRVITGSLKAKCQQDSLGCKWQGFISEYFESHIQKCDFVVIGCKFSGCNEKFQRRYEKRHLEICEHRLVPCQYCLEEIHHLQMKEHLTVCPYYLVTCPKQGCDVLTQRNHMTSHLSNNCQEVHVDCPYKEIGCDFKCKRKDLQSHEQSFSHGHTKLLFGHFNNTSVEYEMKFERVQSELTQTRDKLDDTRQLYESACVEIDQLKQKDLDTVILLNEKFAEMKLLNTNLQTQLDNRLQEQKIVFEKTIHEDQKKTHEKLYEQNVNVIHKIEILAKVIRTKHPQNIMDGRLQNIADQIEQIATIPPPDEPLVLHINDDIKYDFTPPSVKDVMKQMVVGKLYLSQDERRIYFKLKMDNKKAGIFFYMSKDVKKVERKNKEHVTFANDNLCLLNTIIGYELNIQINGWMWDKCLPYIYEVNKHPPTIKLMEYYWNYDVKWDDFVADDEYVLILLQKTLQNMYV